MSPSAKRLQDLLVRVPNMTIIDNVIQPHLKRAYSATLSRSRSRKRTDHRALTKATRKKPGGKSTAPPLEGARPSDQINLTDEESRIMPIVGGGFEQCYSSQAAVAAGSLLVVAVDVVHAPNDKRQVEPMLEKVADLPDALGSVGTCQRL